MEDWQFGLLLTAVTTGLGGIAAAVSWGAKRITKTIDRNTEAMVKNTESNAVLSTKIDSITDYIHRERDKTPVEGVPIRNERGRYHVRRKSEPGENE